MQHLTETIVHTYKHKRIDSEREKKEGERAKKEREGGRERYRQKVGEVVSLNSK